MEEYLKQIALNLERNADSLDVIDWKLDCISAKLETTLNELKKSCSDISYTEELRMYHSCVDCRFLEQCQSDADLEGVQFDYLVCENFQEAAR